jgi:hypothetical protein
VQKFIISEYGREPFVVFLLMFDVFLSTVYSAKGEVTYGSFSISLFTVKANDKIANIAGIKFPHLQ